MVVPPITELDVRLTLDRYTDSVRNKLLTVRHLIYKVASNTLGVGTIEETLKWGQVSYLTHKPKSGTTIRIDQNQDDSEEIAVLVHCQTSLIETISQIYPDTFQYEGTRALVFDSLDATQTKALEHFIELALTYHLD